MGLFTKHRRDAKLLRELNVDVMSAGLDALKDVEGTPETRQSLTDGMKSLLKNNADLETVNCEVEYETGKLVGIFLGAGALASGYAVGKLIIKGIRKFIMK